MNILNSLEIKKLSLIDNLLARCRNPRPNPKMSGSFRKRKAAEKSKAFYEIMKELSTLLGFSFDNALIIIFVCRGLQTKTILRNIYSLLPILIPVFLLVCSLEPLSSLELLCVSLSFLPPPYL